jgi:hypothetical protein
MANFAIIENGIVVNTIVAESKAVAEEVTGATCVEFTDENTAFIGLGYSKGKFEKPVIVEEPTE